MDHHISIYSHLALAQEYSCKSTAYRKLGAVIARKHRALSGGYNINKTHPVYANGVEVFSVHAEMHALIRCTSDTKGATLFVYRRTVLGEPAMAKPCKYCMAHIIEAGIVRVYYTIPVAPYFESLEIIQ